MIRVGICDDETNIRSYLASLVRKQEADCRITEYGSADALLAAGAAGEEHDLLFLDIDLGGAGTGPAADCRNPPCCMDGIALARRLRSMKLHRQPLIVFVTGYDSYVYEAFDVEAFQYLIKPIDETRFAELFRRAAQRIASGAEQRQTQEASGQKRQPAQTASGSKPPSESAAAETEQRRRSLVVQQAGVRKVVPWDSIYYAESQGHKVLLHLKDGILESYGKIGELERSLPEQFCRIHKGYLVNLAYVEEYTHTAVTLTNGEQLLISKYKYDAFAKAHLRYLQ